MYNGSLCPLCSSKSYKPFTKATDVGYKTYDYRRCDNCHTVYLGLQLSQSEISDIYEASYYGSNDDKKFLRPVQRAIDWFRYKRAQKVSLDILQSSSTSAKFRCLDIGCGDGIFLAQMKQLGFDIYGTEIPGPAASRAAKIEGINLHLGNIEDAEYKEQFFNIVTMWHVIEHLPDTSQLAQKIAWILKPGGKLHLSYPNIASWQAQVFKKNWLHLDPPRHLWLAPPEKLILMFEKHGFKLVSTRHFSAEQNIYGIIQSLLNLLPQRRDFLYEALKGNRNGPVSDLPLLT
ncbi:MAG: class I SAM-dependent methyltransferase, partial [bacterium]|nr:class I SAM-dependent methyltransferase [bacterium]